MFALIYNVAYASDWGNYWFIGNYGDEFGEATEQEFVYTEVEGKFSDSAVANRKMTTHVRFEPAYNFVGIMLDKYSNGEYEQTYTYAQDYTIIMKSETGYKFQTTGLMNKSNTIVLDPENITTVYAMLNTFEKIQVYVKEEYGTATYNFTITTVNGWKQMCSDYMEHIQAMYQQ